jgi:hypothetical protein
MSRLRHLWFYFILLDLIIKIPLRYWGRNENAMSLLSLLLNSKRCLQIAAMLSGHKIMMHRHSENSGPKANFVCHVFPAVSLAVEISFSLTGTSLGSSVVIRQLR